MRSAKKYLVGLSTAAMVLGTIATGASVSAASQATSAAFSDISGNSAAAAITFLAQAGIINGTGNGQYSPSAPVTREEFAKIVVNLIGKGNVAAALQNVTPSFTDATSIDSWAWGYVNVAADMGIIKGYPDGSFGPTKPVSDVEAAAMLIRAVGDDEPGIVSGSWPGNYVAAAYNLGLTGGVTFIANLPASRADIAQLSYNDVVLVKTAQAEVSGTTTTWVANQNPLYYAGTNGYSVLVGTVGGVSSSNITINGTTKNWENNYQLVGVTNTANLLGLGVVALVDGSGNVSFLTLQSGVSATPNTTTLADGNTAVPSGFWRVSGAGDYVVTNNYNCGATGLSDTGDCGGNLYILTGGSTPATVQLEGYSNASTQYVINAASSGVNTDSNASVPDITYLNSTTNGGNADDDSVSYILDKNNKISTLYDTHVTVSAGLVNSTTCPSGCDNTPANAGAQQTQIEINGTWYNVQGYTTLTLNGASATLSKSLDNAVAYADVVGNGFNKDINLTNVAMYQNTVSGTVTATVSSNGSLSSFTIQPSSGSSQSISVDSGMSAGDQGKIVPGAVVTVALDSAGKARAVLSTSTVSAATVGVVTGEGSTSTTAGTTFTVTLNDGGVTYTVNAYPATVFQSTYANGSGNANNGGVLYTVNTNGVATLTALSSAITPQAAGLGAAGDVWQVVSENSSSAVLGAYTTAGGSLDTSVSSNPYLSVVLGGAFKGSNASSLGFGGLKTNDKATVYDVVSGGQTYYAVIDQGQ